MEKKVLIKEEEEELKRLMDRQKEAEKNGKIFYSENQSHMSKAEEIRKMAIDFLESKLLDDKKEKIKDQQNNDLQLLNAFFEEEIKYLKQYSHGSKVDITAGMIKTKFAEFLRGGREIDLTYQELTLFVNIIDDVQALIEEEKGKDKKVANDRLSNIEKNNPKLINAMKAQTEIYKSTTQINNNKNKVKKSVMPGNHQHLNLETQIEKQIKPEFKQNIQLNNINIDNFNQDFGKMNLNNNHINIQKPANKLNKPTSKIEHVNYDFDEDPKESDIHANFNINEFLNKGTDMKIKKEQQKFKKIDVKKNNNMRRGTQIVDNINKINNDNFDNDQNKTFSNEQNKTFVNKHDPKKMFKNVLKLNPQTAVIKKGRNIWKNNNGIGNQSMMDPNMTSKTQIEDKKETKTEVKISKKSVNDKNAQNQINNNNGHH